MVIAGKREKIAWRTMCECSKRNGRKTQQNCCFNGIETWSWVEKATGKNVSCRKIKKRKMGKWENKKNKGYINKYYVIYDNY